MKFYTGASLLTVLMLLSAGTITFSHAGEDVGTAAKNTASDASNAGKESARWTKRQGRKVTGDDNATKDAQDRAANKNDEMQNDANKAKNRAQENQ